MHAAAKVAGTPPAPLWDLIEESRDDAAFLWRRRETELVSITRNLDEVWSWTEDRLQGAMDGVRIADTRLIDVLEPYLKSDERGQLMLAAHLLANAPAPGARELLTARLRDAGGAVLDALTHGIETATLNGTFATVTAMLAQQSPVHCAALCRIKTFQRAMPGQELVDAFQSDDPQLQAQALHAAAFLPIDYCKQWVEAGLRHAAMPVRIAAMTTGIHRRIATAWQAAVQCVRETPHASSTVLKLLAMFGTAQEHQLVTSCLQHESLRPAAIQALALIGTPEAVELLLGFMRDPQLGRFAGEAYCLITGAELERDKLAKMETDSDNAPVAFEADDLDANLVPAAHESWPLPDTDAVTAHWLASCANFTAGVRHLRGQPSTNSGLLQAIESGPMLWRSDHALELAVRSNGQFDVETRAFREVQQRMLTASRGYVTA